MTLLKEKKKILIIEDEKALARLLELALTHEGYETKIQYDGDRGFADVSNYEPDLILLDLMLPGMDGIEVCRKVRKFSFVPILMLTARDETVDKVTGLDCGANDYMTKPFEMEELLARIRAILRASENSTEKLEILAVSDLWMDLRHHIVKRSGTAITLTKREFDLLEYLMKNRRIVLTREQILERVWGLDYEGEANVVDVYIRYLRSKIDEPFDAKLIQTVRGSAMSLATKLKKPMPRKLSWKLTLIYAALFSAVLIALNAGTLFGVRYYMVEQAKQQVRSSKENTLSRFSASAGTVSLSDPAYLSEAGTVSEINIIITNPSGKQISSSNKTLAGLPSPASDIGNIVIFESRDRHFIVENSRITENNRLIGYLQVSYDMRSEYRFIKLLFVFMAFADLLGVAFAILTGFLLSRRALRPIDNLTNTARKISVGDLSQRVEVGPADDELSRLAVTFNEMIERLQASFEKQSRFVSDASHELRTPIAVIKGYADLIDQWAKDDPQVLEESVAAIRKEANGMTTLVEQLLFLARGDGEKLKPQKENFPASGLLHEIVEESRLVAPNRCFEEAVSENLQVYADRKLLKQALRALVDNAVKYTPEKGTIQMAASGDGAGVKINVTDTGIGIPENELQKIFNRFYRVDEDRSREKGGSGLGLSIVKWIVDAHGGTIMLESEMGKGTSASIYLPKG